LNCTKFTSSKLDERHLLAPGSSPTMDVTSSACSPPIPCVAPFSTPDDVKPDTLLGLPVEIRLQIYSELFGVGRVVLDGGDSQQTSSIVPSTAAPITTVESRSSQLLRTCKTILYEARPILYANTVFHVIRHTFAGSLPSSFTDNHPSAKYICDVIWQMECDILKRWYEDDLQFQRAAEWASLRSLEIRCHVDAWRGSYCGDGDDRTAFVAGRDQLLKYGARLLDGMGIGDEKTFQRLVENRQFLGKGEMRIRLTNGRELLDSDDVVVQDLKN